MADSIKKAKDLFSDFPTVGHRTAGRFVFYLLKQPKEKIVELANAILDLKNKVKLCSFCFNPYEVSKNESLCEICQNNSRNKQLLCIVEKETDLISIENTKKYIGLYFILGGPLNLKHNNLRLTELKERISHSEKFGLPHINFVEIIIAINPTPEGRAAAVLVERILKEFTIKVSHLAQGLPVGGELEYADDETLESAFSGRK